MLFVLKNMLKNKYAQEPERQITDGLKQKQNKEQAPSAYFDNKFIKLLRQWISRGATAN